MSLERTNERRIVGIACTRAGVDDDVDGGQFMLVESKRFANLALQVIASHRVADDAGRNGQSQSSIRTAIGADEDCEQGIGETSRILVDAIELRFVMETVRRCERPCFGVQVALASAGRWMNRVTPSSACGPSHDGERAPVGRHEWPCAHGSREYVDDELCSAGKCAS